MIKEKQHINPTPENNQLYGGNKNSEMSSCLLCRYKTAICCQTLAEYNELEITTGLSVGT